jgi:thiol-disulfide isomerase/thioredoxin
MNAMKRRGLRIAVVMLAAAACLPIARLFAEDTKAPATAPATARSIEAIDADLLAAGKALQNVIGSPLDVIDAKKRAQVAPKAIPAAKKYLALFDEMARQNPAARAQSAQVHGQFEIMLTVMGDADAERELARKAEAAGDEGVEARAALLMARWWQKSEDAAGQQKLLDEAAALMKANPKSDTVAANLMQMSMQGAATPELKAAVRKLVVDTAKGSGAAELIEEADAADRLKALENKPLTIAGQTLEGKQFTTADWKGKVVLVDFWATWCPPCVAELPNVKKLYAANHAKGLEIVGVNCDRDMAKLKAFLADKELPWTQLVSEKDPPVEGLHPLATQLGVRLLPTMILIDRKGIVRTVDAREKYEEMVAKMGEEK